MFYTRRSTNNVRFISCDGHQLYAFKERGEDLEVEGVSYIEIIAGQRHTYWARLLQGAEISNYRAESMHATSSTYTSPETPTCEVSSNGVVEISLLPVCSVDTSI